LHGLAFHGHGHGEVQDGESFQVELKGEQAVINWTKRALKEIERHPEKLRIGKQGTKTNGTLFGFEFFKKLPLVQEWQRRLIHSNHDDHHMARDDAAVSTHMAALFGICSMLNKGPGEITFSECREISIRADKGEIKGNVRKTLHSWLRNMISPRERRVQNGTENFC
jgi:hypothetical protein